VLLIVLWVLSYWWNDVAGGPISRTKNVVLGSKQGRMWVRLDNRRQDGWHFYHMSIAAQLKSIEQIDAREPRRLGTTLYAPPRPVFGPYLDGAFSVAHGLAVLFFATLGVVAAPCIKWRFSLRTLLVATTLVAMLLGLVVYAVRK